MLLTMLNINRVTGDPLPEKQRRYLDGEEDINDDEYDDGGTWRRALDEFKERFGWEKKESGHENSPKRIKLDKDAGEEGEELDGENIGGDEKDTGKGKGKGKEKEKQKDGEIDNECQEDIGEKPKEAEPEAKE